MAKQPASDSAEKRTSVLHQPAFSRLFSASLFSSVGSSAGIIAIIWLVYSTTGSAVDVALIGIAGVVPRVAFGLFSGGLADRYSKTRLMILADFLRASMLFVLIATLISGTFILSLVLGSVFVLGIGQSIFTVSTNSFVPDTVESDQLSTANGLLSSSQTMMAVAGSPLGGVLVSVAGVPVTLLLNALTYVVSGTLIFTVGRRSVSTAEPDTSDSSKRSFFREISEGLQYVRKERGLLKLTLASFVGNFFTSLFFSFIVIYVSDVLFQGSVVFGILSAATGAGFGAGALLAGRRKFERRFGIWFCLGWGISGLSILGLVILPFTIPAAVFVFIIGLGGGFGNTVFFTGVQKFVPRRMLARYLSIDEVGSLAASPGGQASGGFMIASLGISLVYLIASLGIMGSLISLLLFRGVRELSVD